MEKVPSQREQKFLVIGAGLPRTGTYSLKHALEIILPGKCHHMADAMEFHQEEWRDILNGKMSDDEFRHFFLSNYASATDAPFCFHYERAMRLFPDAKVLLSIRDPEGWVKSVEATILQSMKGQFPYQIFAILGIFASYIGKSPFVLIKALLSSDSMIEFKNEVSEGRGVEYFNNWVGGVERVVPKEKLLKYHVKEGWAPLCKFLDVPVPDVPFPNINSTAEFQGRSAMRNRRSWLLLYEIVTIPILGYLCYKMR